MTNFTSEDVLGRLRVMTAQEIVRELASMSASDVSPLDGWQQDSWCLFCEVQLDSGKKECDRVKDHAPECLWRRAQEWVQG